MKKKIYIAGKVTGLDIDEVTKKFNYKEYELTAKGYEVVNPMRLNHDHNKEWESYMKVCLAELIKCDAIYLMPDWKESKGAKLEKRIAYELKLDIIYDLNPLEISLFHIIEMVEINNLKEKNRKLDNAFTRHYLSYLLYKKMGLTLKAVGKIINRNYGTIINSLRKHYNLTETRDRDYIEVVTEINRRLKL